MVVTVGRRINEQRRSNPLGLRTEVVPLPLIPENTRFFNVGRLSIGLEYRFLNDEAAAENLGRDSPDLEAIKTRRLRAGFQQGEFIEEGPSVHIIDASEGKEYVRFDLFAGEPHYHYIPSSDYHYIVPFDPIATGDFLDFVVEAVSFRLPAMLRFAGADDLADHVATIDMPAIAAEVRAAIEEMLSEQRD